jgi:alcohol dehydrogenase class IV
VLSTPHAETNATILPPTMEAMRSRAPAAIESLAGALGADAAGIRERIAALGGGARRLRDLGAEHGRLRRALDAILSRAELQNTPDPPGREELERLLEAAW